MIAITKIEWVDCGERELFQYASSNYGAMRPPIDSNGEYASKDVIIKTIRGRRFRRATNGRVVQDVVVGIAQDPSNILGLQYEAFDRQEETINLQSTQITALKSEIKAVKNAGFLTRLAWLIKGYNGLATRAIK